MLIFKMTSKWCWVTKNLYYLNSLRIITPKNPIKFTCEQSFHSTQPSFGEDILDGIQLRRVKRTSVKETDDVRRARLLYQSRKRGNLENGILLSTFAAEHLHKLTPEQLSAYDDLINLPDNEWDIYYWITKAKEAPKYFQTDVLKLLQEHCKNTRNEQRYHQPSLY
ncbi:unnamed protein product [Trichobilharzia szidati]|nr:unnamed protein product [Trichobilharzia szidati]